jgi:hypothetical protein
MLSKCFLRCLPEQPIRKMLPPNRIFCNHHHAPCVLLHSQTIHYAYPSRHFYNQSISAVPYLLHLECHCCNFVANLALNTAAPSRFGVLGSFETSDPADTVSRGRDTIFMMYR